MQKKNVFEALRIMVRIHNLHHTVQTVDTLSGNLNIQVIIIQKQGKQCPLEIEILKF